MPDIIDNGNETAELFLKAAIANRERTSLSPCGRCYYCDENVRPDSLFCSSECGDDWHEEQRKKRIAGR